MVRGTEARITQLAVGQVLWLPSRSSLALGKWQQSLLSDTVPRPVEDTQIYRADASLQGAPARNLPAPRLSDLPDQTRSRIWIDDPT